jgi:thioredoxin reductase (NADPH)
MSRYLIDQIEATENVHLEPQREIVSVHGTGHLESLTVRHTETGEAEDVRASALFIFIGSEPNSQLVEGLVATDDKGFVLTGADLPKLEGKPRGWALDRDPYILETNAPGIFAVGDVRGGSSKRVAAAVGEGSTAVRLVHEYLATV